MKNIKILQFTSKETLFEFAANDFKSRVLHVLKNQEMFFVALSGGHTPLALYNELTKHKDDLDFPWNKLKIFFGDERYVPEDSMDNNYFVTKKYLFSKLPIPAENIFPILTSFKDPNDSALDYERTLRDQFYNQNCHPSFDLIYLGLGSDGHTASLMPESHIVKNELNHVLENRWVLAEYIPKLKMTRVTFTPQLINEANTIIFLVQGPDKAHAVNKVLKGKSEPLHYPAQLIESIHGEVIWLLDASAGSEIA